MKSVSQSLGLALHFESILRASTSWPYFACGIRGLIANLGAVGGNARRSSARSEREWRSGG